MYKHRKYKEWNRYQFKHHCLWRSFDPNQSCKCKWHSDPNREKELGLPFAPHMEASPDDLKALASLQLGFGQSAPLPTGFVVGIALVCGVFSGGSVAALLRR